VAFVSRIDLKGWDELVKRQESLLP
jgi:hypothetical protein